MNHAPPAASSPNEPRRIVVAGMHRSGTSLVTRVLNLLGLELGDHDALIPPSRNNPHGYWENRHIVATNDNVLAKLGGSWKHPPSSPKQWYADPHLQELRSEAFKVLSESFPNDADIVLKDPRFSLLLPFWRTVTPVSATLVCIRDPAEVAQSLGKRDGLDPAAAAELWITYVVEALANDSNATVVCFQDWLRDPLGTARHIAESLDLPPPDESQAASIASFIDPQANRSYPIPDSSEPMGLAQWLYYLLLTTPQPRPTAQLIEGLQFYLQTRRAWEQHAHHLGALEEAHRQEADAHLNDLRVKERQLSFYYERLQDQEARLEAARTDTASLRATSRQEARHHQRQLAEIRTLLKSLSRDVRLLSSSRRWQISNAIGTLFQPFSPRRHSENALHRIDRTLTEVRALVASRNGTRDQE